MYQNPPKMQPTDKFIGYMAVPPNRRYLKLFQRAEIQNVLVSYHYIRQNPKFAAEILQMTEDRGGVFMTDSGAFSFLNDEKFNPDTYDWYGYVREYTDWLSDNSGKIFSACNLDVDLFVGHDKVVRWNEDYFHDINKDINVVYVAHKNVLGRGDLDGFKEYCKKYDYVAVNDSMSSLAPQIYQEAIATKTNIHGLAWTKPSILKDYPFFSVDSSSWVLYQKYGVTQVFDGTNYKQYDKDNKDIRRTLKSKCEKYGVKYYEFCYEKDQTTNKHNDEEGLIFCLRTWLDTLHSLKSVAKAKLKTTVADMVNRTKVVEPPIELEAEEVVEEAPKKRSRLEDRLNKQIHTVEITEEEQTVSISTPGSDKPVILKRLKKQKLADVSAADKPAMVQCNFCSVQDKCPLFQADHECGFDFTNDMLTMEPMKVQDLMIDAQMERVNRAIAFEQMDGGQLNKNTTAELKLLEQLNNSKINAMLLMQNKGLKITKTTLEMGGGMEELMPAKEEPKGILAILTEALVKKK